MPFCLRWNKSFKLIFFIPIFGGNDNDADDYIRHGFVGTIVIKYKKYYRSNLNNEYE